MQDGNGSTLAVVEPASLAIPPTESAVANWRRTTDIAGLVRAVVLNCTVEIQKRKYLTVAGYQAVANAFGCVASARDVVRVEGGWQAVGEVKRMSDGMVLSTGVGFLGDDEAMWKTRPQFSKMAMAQTRACGRALRAAFAFMAPVIDGNLQTTPAEEMEMVQNGTIDPPAPRGNAALRNALRPSPPQSVATAVHNVLEQQRKFEPRRAEEPPPHTDADFRLEPDRAEPTAHVRESAENAGQRPTHDRNRTFRFGKSANTPLHSLSDGDLAFYEKCLTNDLASADPAKQKYAQQNTLALADVQAEKRFRGL